MTSMKNNVPRDKWAKKFGLPRPPAVASPASRWARLRLAWQHRGLFLQAGWQAVLARDTGVISDPDYAQRLRFTLGEYLNWYFSDKAFLHSLTWMGIPTRKLVTDVWIYQEIIVETAPDLIIEIGSFYGGSTQFLAQMLDACGQGEVLSIDVSHEHFRARHARIRTITADCSSPDVVREVERLCEGKRVMLIHDGDHTAAAVARDLALYARFVTPGMYLIVEDGVVDILDARHSKIGRAYPDGGPLRAVRSMLPALERDFELDMRRERFLLTTNPQGYFRRRTESQSGQTAV